MADLHCDARLRRCNPPRDDHDLSSVFWYLICFTLCILDAFGFCTFVGCRISWTPGGISQEATLRLIANPRSPVPKKARPSPKDEPIAQPASEDIAQQASENQASLIKKDLTINATSEGYSLAV